MWQQWLTTGFPVWAFVECTNGFAANFRIPAGERMCVITVTATHTICLNERGTIHIVNDMGHPVETVRLHVKGD